MINTVRWLQAIYFDASILCKLPHDLSSAELVELQRLEREIGLFVPEIAAKEWVFRHQQIVKNKYESMVSAARTIGKYLQRDPLEIESIKKEDLLEQVEKIQFQHLTSARMKILPTPQVDVACLAEMAIKNQRPFQAKDRGFRDTLIAFTIAEHAKKFTDHYILFVAEDKVFQSSEVLNLFKQSGSEPHVATSLSAAVDSVYNLVGIELRTHVTQDRERILAFLIGQQESIFDYVRANTEFSESFLRGTGFGSDKTEFFGRLKEVRQVHLLEITRAIRGHVTIPDGTETGKVPITITVKATFDITVTEPTFGSLFPIGRKFRIEGPTEVSEESSVQYLEEIERDLNVERSITIEATASEDNQGFSNLRIEKILTY